VNPYLGDIRLSPAGGGAVSLDHETYDLRGRDGKRICRVSRQRAEEAIANGSLELWSGPAGAYLRSPETSYPDRPRLSSISPDSLHTLHGREAAALANPQARYRHNHCGCSTWPKPAKTTSVNLDQFSEHPEKLTAHERIFESVE
jgi:hypothetical protein